MCGSPELPAAAVELLDAAAVDDRDARLTPCASLLDAAGATVALFTEDVSPEVASRLAEHCPDAVTVLAGDRIQVNCERVLDVTRFPRQRVVGVAERYTGARLRRRLAASLGVSVADVTAPVLGTPAAPVVLAGRAAVAGTPLTRVLEPDALQRLLAEALASPAIAVEPMAAAAALTVGDVIDGTGRVMACVAQCQGEYGISGRVAGVPVRLGREGIAEIDDWHLDADELARLHASL